MKKFLTMSLLLGTTALAFEQGVVASLLTPTKAATPGSRVSVNLVLLNPAKTEAPVATPDVLHGRLTAGASEWPVELRAEMAGVPVVVAPGAFIYRSYTLDLPAGLRSRAVLEIQEPVLVRAVIEVHDAPAVSGAAQEEQAVAAPLGQAMPQLAAAQIQRTFPGNFSTNRPIYFLLGPDKPVAKFQFSFKYRLYGDQPDPSHPEESSLNGLYFGYTQRSLWDIGGYSSPFYDTSYMPELIFQSQAPLRDAGGTMAFQWMGYSAAVQHESNGRGDAGSRSMNIVYVRPMLSFGRSGGWWLVFMPKVFAYVGDLSDNPDIARYRGYGEYTLAATKNDSLQVAVTGRIGNHGDRGSVQVDLTYPVHALSGDFATFLQLQYFNGYGESLLNYQEKSSTVRLGIALVR